MSSESYDPPDSFNESPIDDELIQIYIEEAEEILNTIQQYLERSKLEPSNKEYIIAIKRELHTLKGGARMVNQALISELAHELESLYEWVELSNGLEQNKFYEAALRGHDTLHVLIENLKLKQPYPNIASVVENIKIIKTKKESSDLPQEIARDDRKNETIMSSSASDVDDDLVQIFLEEAEEILNTIQQCLEQWKLDPPNKEYAVAIKRELHTLKGGARMVNQIPVSELAHELESLYEWMELNNVLEQDKFYEVAVRGHDALHELIEGLKQKKPYPDIGSIMENIRISKTKEDVQVSGQKNKNEYSQKKETVSPKSISDMVKLSMTDLDEMNNLAGENAIMGVHVQQQFQMLKLKSLELKSISRKMIEQLRKIEMESQVKMAYREESGSFRSAEGFDVLEVDRYSKLQTMVHAISETTNDFMANLEVVNDLESIMDDLLIKQFVVSENLKFNLIRVKLESFSSIVPRLKRITRQVSEELKKDVRLEVLQAEGNMDRSMLEKLIPVFEHMLRNSIDHGIEESSVRIEKKKPGYGTIQLGLNRRGAEVSIELSDDGAGIDVNTVKKKAVSLGLLKENADIDDREALRLILAPGFSTKEQVTQISGRGIGMDVVNMGIKNLGGSLDIASEKGVGTKFSIKLPFTLSANKALIFFVQNNLFGIPFSSILGIGRISAHELKKVLNEDEPEFVYAKNTYPLRYSGEIIYSVKKLRPNLLSHSFPILVLKGYGTKNGLAIVVDSLLGGRDIVIKSLGRQLSKVSGCVGLTVLGDGRMVIILDAVEIEIKANVRFKSMKESFLENVKNTIQQKKFVVMVVDDSLTVRRVTSKLLERYDYEVIQAKNGQDALLKLEKQIPDIMLLDFEMPKMNGLELALTMRGNIKFKNIPIIMITSRTAEKHRSKALESGVNKFLGKPYNESELLSSIKDLLLGKND